MKKNLIMLIALFPLLGKSYEVNIYLTSHCANPVLVSGYVLGGYSFFDNEDFSFVCYPGDSSVLHTVKGIGLATGIFWNSGLGYSYAQSANISSDCSYPSPLGSQPDDNKDFSNNNNDGSGQDGDCGSGMPIWEVSEPYISLWLHDEPLGYQPAVGPRISFHLDYKQRESAAGYNTNWFSVGKKWNNAWFGYITQDINTNQVVNFPCGGQETFYSNRVDILTSAVLSGDSTNGFTLTKVDGSKDVYGFVVTNASGIFQEAFLSERWNAQGQKLTLNYFAYSPANPVIRLQSVVDGDGRTNLVYYNNTNSYSTNLISQVTDAFGRNAYFAYNENGDLTNLTDVAGNVSAVNYDTNEWVTNMITPYGATGFTVTDNGTNATPIGRSILITRPDWSQELYLNQDTAPGEASSYATTNIPNTSPFVNTFDNSALDYHDTYHWGPRQYANLSTTNIASFSASDFLKAYMKHWLTDRSTTFGAGGTLSLEREPSPDSGGSIKGQMTWYDYPGKAAPGFQGTWLQPSIVAKVLPDGTTAFAHYDRNPYGLTTTNINTYSANDGTVLLRTNIYAYAANQIDLVRATNALGVQVVSNYFNTFHQVLTNYNALNERTVFQYKTNTQQLASTTLPTGVVVTNRYGPYNLLTNTAATGFSTNSFTYVNDLVLTHKDARGLVTTNIWDNLNRLTGTAFPDGSSISNVYTILDLTATKDRLGNWAYLGYDPMRRNTTITNALNNVTTFTYCTCGALESIIDAAGNTNYYSYDNQGNQTEVDYADGYSTMRNYNLLHQVVTASDSSGASVTNLYSNQGLLISSANAAGLLVTNQFDVLDRVTNSMNANGVSVGTVYDKLNRPLTRSFPDTGVENFGYTSNYVAATSHTNQIGNVVLYKYDLLNRKTNELVLGVTTNRFVYSGAGDLLKLIDGNKQTNTFAYDSYGRVTNKLDALGTNIFCYQYDADNRLTNRWTPAKTNTAYQYDAVGNLKGIYYPTSPAIILSYDAMNRLTNMIDAAGTTVYGYDAAGQMLSEGGLWPSDTVSYSYQNRLRTGLNIAESSTSPWSQSYGYDNARRLTSLTSPAGSFNYVYDAVRKAQVALLSLPNGAYITNSFDSVARLAGTTLANSSGTALDAYAYIYNPAGQRTNVVRTAGDSVAYTYDNGGELIAAAGKEAGGVTNRWQEQFGYDYDWAGNVTSRTNNKLVQTFKVNALNEMTNNTRSGTFTVTGTTTTAATNVTVNTSNAVRYADFTFAATNFTLANGTNTFTAIAKDSLGNIDTNVVVANLLATNKYLYDLNGNMRTNGNQVLDYDDENQLIRVTATNAWKEEFVYDGKFRRRIEKDFQWDTGSASWQLTNEVLFIYDGNVVIEERNSNNVPLVTYTRGNDLSGTLQGAGGIGGLLARSDYSLPPTSYYSVNSYFHTDGNGNVTMLVNASQTMVAKYLHDPFGNVISMSGTLATANTYRFSSKEWNAQTGFYYFGRRYYEPNLQRWLNHDPIGERGGINLYDYVHNNPINMFDPFGLQNTVGNSFALLGIGGGGGMASIANPQAFSSFVSGASAAAPYGITPYQVLTAGDNESYARSLDKQVDSAMAGVQGSAGVVFGVVAIHEGVGMAADATGLRSYLPALVTGGSGVYGVTSGGAQLTGNELPGSISMPGDFFNTFYDFYKRDPLGIGLDLAGWFSLLCGKANEPWESGNPEKPAGPVPAPIVYYSL